MPHLGIGLPGNHWNRGVSWAVCGNPTDDIGWRLFSWANGEEEAEEKEAIKNDEDCKKSGAGFGPEKRNGTKNRDTVLLILSVGFLVGGVLGCLLEGKLSTEHYIGQFFQQAAQMSIAPSLWREVWIVFRWPVAVILLSQLPLAGVTIPVVFFLRGFFLSYGIVALMEGMGLSGVLCAGVVFGPTCLLAVPVLFVLGTTGLLRKAESQPKGIPFFRRMVASLLVLALCVFLDQAVVPKLLGILLKALTMVSG